MSARSVLRGLGYMLKEVEAFVPWQAWRCALGRDFAWRQSQAAYAHDAGLTAFEEENEVHEPRAQCKWCGGVDTPGHDCGRKYHEGLSPLASAGSGGSPVGVESPTPPAGVDPPSRTSPKVDGEGPAGDRGIRSSAPAGHLNFAAWATTVIADELADHTFGGSCECRYVSDGTDRDWQLHVSREAARSIEAALTREGKHVIVTQIYP